MESTNQKTVEGVNFSATHVGNIAEFQGKLFLRESIKSTGAEVSLTSLAPQTQIPILHFHKKNEEIYIVLTGKGDFLVDDIIRVEPAGERSMRNTSGEPIVYLCIQAKAGSLEETTHGDGVMVKEEQKW